MCAANEPCCPCRTCGWVSCCCAPRPRCRPAELPRRRTSTTNEVRLMLRPDVPVSSGGVRFETRQAGARACFPRALRYRDPIHVRNFRHRPFRRRYWFRRSFSPHRLLRKGGGVRRARTTSPPTITADRAPEWDFSRPTSRHLFQFKSGSTKKGVFFWRGCA